MSTEERKMNIASCRICLLSKSNCATCPLNWALKIVEDEDKKIEFEKARLAYIRRLEDMEQSQKNFILLGL